MEEGINLKKYKELFKTLPEEEYSLLEMVLDKGLNITKLSVEGEGCKLSGKETIGKFVQKLPMIHSKFKALERAEKTVKEKEALHKREGQGKRFEDYLIKTDNHSKACTAWAIAEISTTFCLMTYYVSELAKAAELGLTMMDLGFWASTLGFFGSVWMFSFNLLAIPIIWTYEKKYGGTTGLAAAGLAYITDNKSGAGLSLARRKQRKLETKLGKNIKNTFYSSFPYTRKWFREEKEELKKLLCNRDQEFPTCFLEVENKLLSYDKISLHKGIEQCLNDSYENTGKNAEDYELFACKLSLAKKAGVQIGELEERFQRDTKKTAKRFERLADYL